MRLFFLIILFSLIFSNQTWSFGFITTGFWQNAPLPTGLPVLSFSNLPANESFTGNLNVSVGGANVFKYRYKLGLASSTDCTNSADYSVAPISVGLNIMDSMSELTNESYKICGVGINAVDVEQDYSIATEYTWTHFPPVRAIVETFPLGGNIDSDFYRLIIAGTDIDDFKYKTGDGATLDCTDPSDYLGYYNTGNRLLDFSSVDDGLLKLCLVGINYNGDEQSFSDATEYLFMKDAPVQFNFVTAAQSVNEGSGNLNLQVSLKRIRNVDVSLSFGFSGTSLEGSHFNFPVKSATIPSGSLSTTVSIDIQSGIPDGEERILQIYADYNNPDESYPGEVFSSNIIIKDTNIVRTTASEISMKGSHSCLVKANGTLVCWGTNSNAQLGDTTTDERPLPVAVSGSNWRSVSVGSLHTCALKTDNSAHCWGYNSNGQLGTGAFAASNYSSPQAVTGGQSFTKIVSTSTTNCGLTTSKKIFCWGNGTSGQLGDGTFVSKSAPTSISRNDLDWKDIAGGLGEFCAIEDLTGHLYCWGRNDDGLVNQTYSNVNEAFLVDDSDSYENVNIGQFSGCVINTFSELKCWGENYGGEVPLPAPYWSATPVHVDTNFLYKSVAIGIANTGYDPHGCGVTTTDQLRCWGTDSSYGGGALGRRTLMFFDNNDPADVDVGSSYISVRVAEASTCGILTTGELRCFGSTGSSSIPSPFIGLKTSPTDVNPSLNLKAIDNSGSASCRIDANDKLSCIGTGMLEWEINRQWTKILPTLSFKKVALSVGFYGDNGYSCAQDFSDKLWCWSYYTDSSYSEYIIQPTEVVGLTIKDFAVTNDSVCVIDSDDKILCRGGNSSGTLGNGTSGFGTGVYTFTEILGNRTYKKISGGRGLICAIDSLDQIYCWGTDGTLGDGTTAGSATPVQVNDATSYADFSVRQVACGITTSGVLKCWGYNLDGQVGNGRPSSGARVLSPTAVTGAITFASVYASAYETACGVSTASKLYCWGKNRATFGSGDNRLATGSFASYLTVPTAVDSATDYASVSTAYRPEQNCAITTGQKFKCWGKFNSSFYYESMPNAFGFDHAIPYTVPGVTGN